MKKQTVTPSDGPSFAYPVTVSITPERRPTFSNEAGRFVWSVRLALPASLDCWLRTARSVARVGFRPAASLAIAARGETPGDRSPLSDARIECLRLSSV